jgi:hypothetical protein
MERQEHSSALVRNHQVTAFVRSPEKITPRHPNLQVLHGHEPFTRNFASITILAELKTDLVWLREQVFTAIRRGDERAAIY